MGDTFSKRQGIGVCSGPLIFDDAPQTLRVGIWNLIEDSVNYDSLPVLLPPYEALYKKVTSHFRIKRVSGYTYDSLLKNMVCGRLAWNEVFDLIEFLFVQVSYHEYEERENNWMTIPEKIGSARYEYTKKANELLSSENVGWRLSKGHLERVGSEILDREIVENVRKLLQGRNFAGPSNQFNKALGFFSRRPNPDLENCVKEAVGALEGLARVLLKNNKITLGDAIKELVGKKVIRRPLDKTLHVLYGFVSSEPGSRHGAYDLSSLDIPEAELVLYSSAACMLFLTRKSGISLPVDSTPATGDGSPDDVFPTGSDGDDDIPF